MARTRTTRNETARTGAVASQALRFSTVNAVVGAAALAAIGLGFFLLAQGSITAAPLLLVLGYVVLIPLALIL